MPRAQGEPASDDRHRQRWRDEERQDVVGTVPWRPVTVPVEPVVARQETLKRREQIGIGAGPDLDDHDAGRRVRDEDGQQPVGLIGDERRACPGQIRQTRAAPRPDRELVRPYGKMLRSASRSRPRPPFPGADS